MSWVTAFLLEIVRLAPTVTLGWLELGAEITMRAGHWAMSFSVWGLGIDENWEGG